MTYWDKVSGIYDLNESLNGKVYVEMLRKARDNIPVGARVLDCAAGTGELTLIAALKADAVVCTDNSEKMLERAISKANKKGLSNIAFEKRDIYSQDDADETYDVVMAGNVLHLLDEPERAVKELCRLTKRGGKVIAPCFTDMNGKLAAVYKRFGFEPASYYNSRSYVEMLRRASGETVRAKYIEGLIPCTFAVIFRADNR